ncbi:MAG: non-heme iron oxygenase ferredoxin subunit [Chloroflexi bacterium]|nr:non-heme iron oxygenase ferredoxin subunit [Chloroflexota bacterium]
MPQAFVRVATVEEIPPGSVLAVRVRGEAIALCNVAGNIYAISNVCTHDGGSLDEGDLQGEVIECARHGSQFNVRTGAVLTPPAEVAVDTYKVRVVGRHIEVRPEARR